MLYNGCLKFIRLAAQAIENDDMERKNENLIKAQNIIQELNFTLNRNIEPFRFYGCDVRLYVSQIGTGKYQK